MIDRATDRTYLAYQYGDSERLRIRIEAHGSPSGHAGAAARRSARASGRRARTRIPSARMRLAGILRRA